MEVIRKGSDRIFDSGGPSPTGCCFPGGTFAFRNT